MKLWSFILSLILFFLSVALVEVCKSLYIGSDFIGLKSLLIVFAVPVYLILSLLCFSSCSTTVSFSFRAIKSECLAIKLLSILIFICSCILFLLEIVNVLKLLGIM